MKTNRRTIVVMVQLALLTAIEVIMAFTPLGSLKITPAIGATLAHIPVIIAAVVLGKWAGLYMGTLFGALSFLVYTSMYAADPMAPIFTPFAENAILGRSYFSLIIVFIPRILLGFLTAVIFKWLSCRLKSISLTATISAVAGTIIHTFLVLSFIYLFFGGVYSGGKNYIAFIIAWAGINCLLEIAIAAIITGAVTVPLKKIIYR